MLLTEATTPPRDTTAATAATTADAGRVRAAIAQLPPVERDLLVLRFRDGRTTAELAAAAGTTPERVLGHLHHAAWVVQDLAGITPRAWGEPEPALLVGRDTGMVVEEAGVGITPLLAARLTTAVGGDELPAADDRWRVHAVLRALRGHADGALTGLLVLGVALPAIVSLLPQT